MAMRSMVGVSWGGISARPDTAAPGASRAPVIAVLVFCAALFVWFGFGAGVRAETRRQVPVAKPPALLRDCAECHDVSRGGDISPNLLAPRFYDIARQPSTTALSLRVFLQSVHRRMPDFILSARDRDMIISYILSLKPKKPF